MALLKTYSLFVRDSDGLASIFEPAMCGTHSEAMAKARDLLARHPSCEAVEAYLGDLELFRMKQVR